MRDMCSDKRINRMLGAYAHGALSEQEQTEVNLHILKCRECHEQLAEFWQAADMLTNDYGVREDIKQLVDQTGDESRTMVEPTIRDLVQEGRRKRLFKFSLAAAAVLVTLLLQPWNIRIEPAHEAVASGNSLAIMYFSDLSVNEQPLGPIVTNLLITDLSESQYLHVVSSQRLHDILRLIDEKSDKIDRNTASRVAEKARAKWMLLGNVIQDESRITITGELIDAESGETIASQKVVGRRGESVFSTVDQLTVQVKEDLDLPEAAMSERDPRIVDITTDSPEAYRHFIAGLVRLDQFHLNEARLEFTKALEYDSTIAMAYYCLYHTVGRKTEQEYYIKQAVKFSYRAARTDRLYIQSQEASCSGDYEKAIVTLEELLKSYPYEKLAYWELGMIYRKQSRWSQAADAFVKAIGIDPLFRRAYNMLAYTYFELDNIDMMIWALEKYSEIAPNDANPLDSRGQLMARIGRFDDAITSFQRALEVDSTFLAAAVGLAHMYLHTGKPEEAIQLAKMMRTRWPESEPWIELYEAHILTYQGQLQLALQVLESFFGSRDYEYEPTLTPGTAGLTRPLILRGDLHWNLGHQQEAIASYDDFFAKFPEAYVTRPRLVAKYLWMVVQTAGEQEALPTVRTWKKKYQGLPAAHLFDLMAEGVLAYARGDHADAIDFFNEACTISEALYPRFMRAKSYFMVGQYSEAIVHFKDLTTTFHRRNAYGGLMNVQAHYYLAVAYEKNDQVQKAIAEYRFFARMLKDGEVMRGELEDALSAINRLENNLP